MRAEAKWDWVAFKDLSRAMFEVAKADRDKEHVEKWIGQGYWFCDTWIRSFSAHPSFPRPETKRYEAALEILSDLAFYYFEGVCPYQDEQTLQRKIEDI
jgi:hypothetical protein